MIEFNCKNCGLKVSVQDQFSGKRVKCPKCSSVGFVPDDSVKIKFHCQNCGQSISVPQIHAGKKGKCPKCKNVVVVPISEVTQAKSTSLVSFTCSMCDETIQVPETSIGKPVECPECGSYVETSSEAPPDEYDASADEDLYQEETEEYEESEGVDKRIIVGISAVAAVVVVGLIILAAALRFSKSRPAGRPERLRAQQQVADTDSRPRPVTSDTQPTEQIVQEPPKEDILPEEQVSSEDKLYEQTKIAFRSDRDGYTEIYIMNPDGSGQRNLTKAPSSGEMWPSWSPDGKKIAFRSSDMGRNYDISVMNADGSQCRNLTNNPADDRYPIWSPDGTKIVYIAATGGQHSMYDIYVMNSDGSEIKNLTNDPARPPYPSWSPDGKKIACFLERDGDGSIYVMNADGSEQRRLGKTATKGRGDGSYIKGEGRSSWSPDGRMIAFILKSDVYVIRADGSGRKRLVDNPTQEVCACWSPDGRRIAFISYRGRERKLRELHVMNYDGSEQEMLADYLGDDCLTWSPDGQKIAFISNRDGNNEIYVIKVDGSGLRNLTNNPANEDSPIWSPFLPSVAKEESKKEDTQLTEPVEAVPLPKPVDIVTNSIGMKLVYIPAGSFMMGSPSNEKGRSTSEGPQHQVRISKGFWMGQTEITHGQYNSVMNDPSAQKPYMRKLTRPGKNGTFMKLTRPGGIYRRVHVNNPAVYVNWYDATEFCRKLSQREGKTYRLPTEAEWEYACRAGSTTQYFFGDDQGQLDKYAWYAKNSDWSTPPPVGKKTPNKWGLYDMHGSVWEMCSDWHDYDYYSNSPSVDPKGPSSGRERSMRGGSLSSDEHRLRCSFRDRYEPDRHYSHLGFRVVCSDWKKTSREESPSQPVTSNRGTGGSINDISDEVLTWVICMNKACNAEYEMSLKEYYKFVTANASPMGPAPALTCEKCQEPSVYKAEKCQNAACGIVFRSGSVPNDFQDRCPKCKQSATEEIRKARMNQPVTSDTQPTEQIVQKPLKEDTPPTESIVQEPPSKADGGAKMTVKLLDPGAQPRTALRYKFQANRTEKMVMETNMAMAMEIRGQKRLETQVPATRMTMSIDSKEVSPEGDLHYEFELEQVEVLPKSGANPAMINAMKQQMSNMQGLRGSATVTSRGFTKDAEITPPSGIDLQNKQSLDEMKQSMNRMSAPLPEEPVGRGASWQVTMPVETPVMKLTQVVTYTLTEIQGDKVKFDVIIMQSAPPQEIDAPGAAPGMKASLESLKSSGKGTIELQMTNLIPTSNLNITTTYVVSANNQKIKTTMRIGMKIQPKDLSSIQSFNGRGTHVTESVASDLRRTPPNYRVSKPRPPKVSRPESPLIGKRAPSFRLRDLSGKRVSLSDFKGKVVILDFWATWCPPCVVEIPHFIALYEQYKDKGFAMVGISTDRKGVGIVRSFAQKNRINYPILMADGRVQTAYGGIRAIPTTFIIDSAGIIRHQYIGYRDKSVFETAIKALLADIEPQ